MGPRIQGLRQLTRLQLEHNEQADLLREEPGRCLALDRVRLQDRASLAVNLSATRLKYRYAQSFLIILLTKSAAADRSQCPKLVFARCMSLFFHPDVSPALKLAVIRLKIKRGQCLGGRLWWHSANKWSSLQSEQPQRGAYWA